MDWIIKTFQQYPELAIFLTLALGYWVGGFKFGKFSLGSVTGVLLAGVLVGQMNITISPNVKSVFFLMFLFAVGYGVGPQFFRGLKSDGVPQVALRRFRQMRNRLGIIQRGAGRHAQRFPQAFNLAIVQNPQAAKNDGDDGKQQCQDRKNTSDHVVSVRNSHFSPGRRCNWPHGE